MLLYFKVFRDIDKAMGSELAKFYDRLTPNSKIRQTGSSHPSAVANHNKQVERDYPELVQLVKETFHELGENTPKISNNKRVYFSSRGTLNLPIEDCDFVIKEHPKFIKALITHEAGHLDTNCLGFFAGTLCKYAFLVSTTLYVASGLNETMRNVSIFTLAAAIITNSYNRYEELRCNRKTLENDISEEMIQFYAAIEEQNPVKSFFANIFELINRHPSTWAMKEELRQSQKEVEARISNGLA